VSRNWRVRRRAFTSGSEIGKWLLFHILPAIPARTNTFSEKTTLHHKAFMAIGAHTLSFYLYGVSEWANVDGFFDFFEKFAKKFFLDGINRIYRDEI
jgi:hypothetical protein